MNRVSYMKKYNKAYYQKNKKREIERAKNWRSENPEKVKETRSDWYKKKGKEYREAHLEQMRKAGRDWARRNPKPYEWSEGKKLIQQRYRLKHKEIIAVKRRAYFHKKISTDINYRLMWLLRSRVMIALKSNLADKAYKTIDLLGCSIQEARQHIEKQFKYDMTWENHGEWEIDHIIPLSSFDLTKPEEQKKAFHYTNLQPLNWQENRKKSNRMMV